MKLPRDLSGKEFIKRLKVFGYKTTRQVGSHVRLTTKQKGEHHITIPQHDYLRVGTLAHIFNEIAIHFEIDRSEVMKKIFE